MNQVKRAIKESRDARDRFVKQMYEVSETLGYSEPGERDEDERQVFGDPVSEEQLLELEKEIHHTLPPTYRAFLSIHDGWKVIDGSQDFFSINEILDWRKRKDPSGWIAIATEAGDGVVGDCLVIGASDDSPDKYLLNPEKVSGEGEWEFIEYSKEGGEYFPSFLDFLQKTKQQFDESREELDMDDYFDPFEYMDEK